MGDWGTPWFFCETVVSLKAHQRDLKAHHVSVSLAPIPLTVDVTASVLC